MAYQNLVITSIGFGDGLLPGGANTDLITVKSLI